MTRHRAGEDWRKNYDRAARTGSGRVGPDMPGLRATVEGGGFQPHGAEGRRAYDPAGRGRHAGSGGDLRGMRAGAVEDMAQPFDEDAALEHAGFGHRGRGPRGYRRSDARIHEDVCERLTHDSHVDATEIEVAVEAGEVTLAGTVDSRSARRRAEDLAESVSGVAYVQNNIRVRDPFYHRDDREAPLDTHLGHGGSLPSGAGHDAGSTSAAGATDAAAGTGAKGSGTGGAG